MTSAHTLFALTILNQKKYLTEQVHALFISPGLHISVPSVINLTNPLGGFIPEDDKILPFLNDNSVVPVLWSVDGDVAWKNDDLGYFITNLQCVFVARTNRIEDYKRAFFDKIYVSERKVSGKLTDKQIEQFAKSLIGKSKQLVLDNLHKFKIRNRVFDVEKDPQAMTDDYWRNRVNLNFENNILRGLWMG